MVTIFLLDTCVCVSNLQLYWTDLDGEDSVPEKKKRKTRDISPIEWDRKSEGKSEEEEGEEEDGKSDDNKSEKSEDSTVRSE